MFGNWIDKASHLTIEGGKENEQEQLIVTDDGVGFDLIKQLQQSNRKGLNIINEVPKLLNIHIVHRKTSNAYHWYGRIIRAFNRTSRKTEET